MGLPAVAGPRSLSFGDTDDETRAFFRNNNSGKPRVKRSMVITDRRVRSADVGVSGLYDVISEADLAFSPDTKQEAVTVFQGKISEEVVYGICMPVPGFSVLFILVTSATIISALIAGSLLYRYQLQKEAIAHQQNASASTNPNMMAANTIASWMTMRLFRMRHSNCTEMQQHIPHPSQQQQAQLSHQEQTELN